LFAGSKEGGKTAAIISSFIATCKHCGINPQHYLLDVLTRLTQGEADLDSLLPGSWTQAALTSGNL
jgi:transposase